MNSTSINNFNNDELKQIVNKLGIVSKNRNSLIEDIKSFLKNKETKKSFENEYDKKEQLGDKGKDGTTFFSYK